MEADHPLRKRYEAMLAEELESLALLKSGALRIGQKTAAAPQWTDTTDQAIQQSERVIAMFGAILGEG